MPTSQNKDTEVFFANVDRLFKLIQNVLAKGQTTVAEKYIVYLFETITRYYIKESQVSQANTEFYDFSVTTSNIDVESSVETDQNSLLGSYHKLKSYRSEFQDDITRLVCSQVKPSNFETFYFIYNLLKDATGVLLNNPITLKGGRQLISTFKFISQYVLFNQMSIPPSERHAYMHQTYDCFLDLLSISIKDEEALLILAGEMREVLRSYIDDNQLELFESFLNSLSSRFFPFSIYSDRIFEKYPFDLQDNYEYRETIEKYKGLLSGLTSVKLYRKIINKFETEVNDKGSWKIDKEEYKQEVKEHLFNIFKLTYCQIILVDAISYALFKRKFDFLKKYLNYHSPEDADASWANENYSLQRFSEIVPFLEDYDRLMPESFMWAERHGIETYLNTFLAYYIAHTKLETITDYINAIQKTDTINTVSYNLQKIEERNILQKLPDELLLDKDKFAVKMIDILMVAKNRREELDREEVQSAPIDEESRENFFVNFFKSFNGQSIARSLFRHYNSVSDEGQEGQNIGINQRFPRKAFIKQSGHMFLSPHSQLAAILADDETTAVFSQIAKRASKLILNATAFEDYLHSIKGKFDLLISANTHNIKTSFPKLNFEESWAGNSPLKKLPGYLGKLDDQMEVFWLGNRLPNKVFILLDSHNLGQLVNCAPPALSGDYNRRHEQFAYSFIDLANDEVHRRKLLEKGQKEEKLNSEVWIRIFESISLILPADFKAEYIEITT